MNGKIEVKSELGVGSTFFFNATFQIVEPVASEAANRIVSIEGTEVLILDDNETNRRILSDMTASWGMVPVVADNAEKAMNILRLTQACGNPLPLIITDFAMPNVDGLDFVESIRNTPEIADAVVIMLSSGMPDKSAARCQHLNLAARLSKPVKQSEVFNAIVDATHSGNIADSAGTVQIASGSQQQAAVRQLNVLLAEDNLVNQKLAIGVLEANGHTITVANNGREAVELWQQSQFDVVLMDVQMPEMDGFEATAEIRRLESTEKISPPTIIVAMTARAKESDRKQCLDAGMDEYLSKPIRIAELTSTLERITSEKRQQPALEMTSEAPSGGPSGDPRANQDTKPEASMIQWEQAAQAVNDDMSLLKMVVETLIDSGPDMIGEVRQSIESQDPKKLRISAHALKGSVLFLGIDKVRLPALQLEMMGEMGEVPDNPQLIEQLESEWAEIKAELDRFVEK